MNKKILIVDDEEDIRDTVRTILESIGYTVEEASSGMDCMGKIRDVKPDLILMDFFMPEMSGRETIEKIRESPELESTKIVFFTVAEFRGEKYRQDMEDLKISGYIQKPIDLNVLLSKVKEIVPPN
ncbi:response regulator [Candidatus Altiarchaeota archaeon]